jgi:DNA-binding XRE family transcriptional regulator
MLSWSRQSLASAADVAERTIVDFERGARRPFDRTLRDIKGALEKGGVVFIDQSEERGPGVQLRDPI